jgi:hypothetical protein
MTEPIEVKPEKDAYAKQAVLKGLLVSTRR